MIVYRFTFDGSHVTFARYLKRELLRITELRPLHATRPQLRLVP